MTQNKVDFSLYIITDADVSRGRMHQEVVRLALEGGATVVHYRDPGATVRRMLDIGGQLRELTRKHNAAFIVNDRPDIAIALSADGVHVGPDDMPADVVRQVVGPDMLIGVSVDDRREAQKAEAAGADYLAARPVFRTRWHTDRRPTMGTAGLREIVNAVGIPVIGAGGINDDNLAEVFQTGIAGLAITSAIASADDPREAAEHLRRLLDPFRTPHVDAAAQQDAPT